MEDKKELTIEDVQKELGNILYYFNALAQQLTNRYNAFHRDCEEKEREISTYIEARINHVREQKGSIYDVYEKEEKKIKREINCLVKKLNEINKVMERKNPNAAQQAKIDSINYDDD